MHNSNAQKLDREPPHDTDAERGVLGSLLLAPDICGPELALHAPHGIQLFYDARHQSILEVIQTLLSENEPVDTLTVARRLKDGGELERVGGMSYIAFLPDAVPSSAHFLHYLNIAVQKAIQRRVIAHCTDFVVQAYECAVEETESLLGRLEASALKIRPVKAHEPKSAKQLVAESISKIEEMHQAQGKILGLPTGLVDLDKLIDGLHGGELVMIGGYPSTGKTVLGMNFAEHIAVELGQPVGVMSLEMPDVQLMMRIICSNSRVNLRDVRDGLLTDRDFPKLTAAAEKLAKAPIHIENSSGWTIDTVQARARRMVQSHGIKVLVVDYLQLVNVGESASEETRASKFGLISKGCKQIAMEHNISVVLLCQLNKDGQVYGSSEPNMDGDVVMKIKNKGEWNPVVQSVELIVDKQRNGPTDTIQLTLLKTITRFESAAKVSQDDVPHYQPDI